ncbi:MAG: pyrroloquinoline quinone biosynthesis peptide chaperone PqqD [Thiotrichales bacterium]
MHRITSSSIPRLADGLRVSWDIDEASFVLLYPEGMVVLDTLADLVLRHCDGSLTVAQIIAKLTSHPDDANTARRVWTHLALAAHRGWIIFD